jgi:DNA modification methylase
MKRGRGAAAANGAGGERPRLVWAGKHTPPAALPGPALQIETCDPAGSFGRAPADPAPWVSWPAAYPRGGLVFQGDNRDVLTHLLAGGFAGQIDLAYLDPPFDSGADYARKLALRGPQPGEAVGGGAPSLGRQVQYTDTWSPDAYLQFMYERLRLHHELLAETGVLVLHCDWKREHLLRCLLDEVFGAERFRNSIYWHFWNKMHDDRKEVFPRATNTLLVYAKGAAPVFQRLEVPRPKPVRQLKRIKRNGVLVNLRDEEGRLVYQERDAQTLDNVWPIPLIPPADRKQKTGYPTQKPEALLELVLLAYSRPDALVLDGFAGSGTTAAVAQRLGRRFIACDVNPGAIQTTVRRLRAGQGEDGRGFTVWRMSAAGRGAGGKRARAKVRLARRGTTLVVAIEDFASPAIADRLSAAGQGAEHWKAMVEAVAIDPAYDGRVFHGVVWDAPARDAEVVRGVYELPAPAGATTVAVRIVDRLGEEVLVTRNLAARSG